MSYFSFLLLLGVTSEMRCGISHGFIAREAVEFAKRGGTKKSIEAGILKAFLRLRYGRHLLEVSPAILGSLGPDRSHSEQKDCFGEH